jgi:hypothetical protein
MKRAATALVVAALLRSASAPAGTNAPELAIAANPGAATDVVLTVRGSLSNTVALCSEIIIEETSNLVKAVWVDAANFDYEGATNFAFPDVYTNAPPMEFYRLEIIPPP